jgi:hypothetical protein
MSKNLLFDEELNNIDRDVKTINTNIMYINDIQI